MSPTWELSVAAQERPWDAIVIGAGPAGAIAARQLALQGKRVLLVDKAKLPRDKVCGGCLGGAALDALESVGLADVPQTCGGVTLSTFTLAGEGNTACVPIGRRVAISRRTFDDALVHAATRAGVIVLDQTLATLEPPSLSATRAVRLKRSGEELIAHGSVIIIATGLAQLPPDFALRIARRSFVGVSSIMDQPPCDIARGELLMACSDVGYVGVTAVEGSRFDVAAAIRPSALATLKSPAVVARHVLASAGLSPNGSLFTTHWHGTPPLTRSATPLGSHRCLLIGDAAAYVEPFTGEGIGWAMQSAILATSLLGGSLAAWDDSTPRRWQQLYHDALAGHQRRCRAVTRLLRHRSLRQLAIRSLQWSPAFSRPIVRRLDRPMTIPVSHHPAAAAYAR
jgi:menaquinone-9 beta-reductase